MLPKPTANHALTPLIDPLLSGLPTEALAALGNTCRLFNTSFKHELSVRKRISNDLIHRVANGEDKAALAILQTNPELLKQPWGEAVDYSGKLIRKLTPLQIALCAGDVDMVILLETVFQAYPEKTGGRQEMLRQFEQLFPASARGLAGHYDVQTQHTFDLAAITAAITRASESDLQAALEKIGASFTQTADARVKRDSQLRLVETLNRFREQFTQLSHAELVFNPCHLIQAFRVYDNRFVRWSDAQRDVFWRQVIGFMQRFLPACDVQAFAQGFLHIDADNPLIRSLDLGRGRGSDYPLDFASCTGLGFDFAGRKEPSCRPQGGRRGYMIGSIWSYPVYISKKMECLEAISRSLSSGAALELFYGD